MEAVAKNRPLSQDIYKNSSLLHPLVYVGTQVETDTDGLFLFRLNASTGELTHVSSAKAGLKPSYLTLDSHHRHLYAINKDDGGGVKAFAVDQKSGALKLLNHQPCPGGPAHISIDHTNKLIKVANYGNGSIATYPVQEDGQLGAESYRNQHEGSSVNKERQEGPHAHFILSDPTAKFAFVADLGLDKILSYKLKVEEGLIAPSDPYVAYNTQPGAGPRHLTFHPNGKFAYLINEIDSTVAALEYDSEKGTFKEINTLSTLPSDFSGKNKCSAIHILPNGKFLYGSNRGHHSIAVFSVEEDTGKIELVEIYSYEIEEPRDFAIDLTGNYLLVGNQTANNISTYHVDRDTGKLTFTGHKIETPTPVCLKVIPDFAD